jgi:CRISPR-associated protein Csb2
METADMHGQRLSDAPGSTWISDPSLSDCLAPAPIVRHQETLSACGFTVARFAIDSNLGHRPLPAVGATLSFGESFRAALLGRCWSVLRRQQVEPTLADVAEHCPAITGKTPDGLPLVGHRHAFYLPTDEDDDGHLDHITVLAEQGFTGEEVRALDRLHDMRLGEGEPLGLLLVGLGRADNLRAPVFASSKTWVSATPFVVTRYPKLRGQKRDRPEDLATPQAFVRRVLHQELDRLRERRPDLPAVVDIVPLDGISRRRLQPIQFQRFRRKRDDDGGRRPSGVFRIIFAEPVQGPICLGHSCHFGLGLFVPEQHKEAAMT